MKIATKQDVPSICVLLAAYNGQNWIQEQIDSILSQKDVKVSLFISVDLSTDDTYSLCNNYENKYKNVSVLPYGDSFSSASKNFFHLFKYVDIEGFDYVALSDQDDIWMPEKLERAVSTLLNCECDAYSSDVMAFWSSGKTKLIKKSYPQKSLDYFFESSGPGCTFVIKSFQAELFKSFLISNWSKVGHVCLHDWLLYAFIRGSGFRWVIDDKPLMLYRQHNANVIGANSGFLGILKRLKMLRSHWYVNEVYKIHRLISPSSDFQFNVLFIITNFWQMRRRPRDAIILLILTILGMNRYSKLKDKK